MRRRIAVLLAVASLFGLAACGDDDDVVLDDDTTTTTAPQAFEVLVNVDDDKITAAPDSVPAGLVKFTVTSTAKGDVDVNVAKLEAGKTTADLTAELAKNPDAPPAFIKLHGGPLVLAGKSTTYETIVDEGSWSLVVPPDEESKSKARLTSFAVTASATAAAVVLPKTDATVTGTEYAYTIEGLKAGKNRITVKNTGGLPHIYVVFGLKPDAKLDDVLAYEGDGQPPGLTEFNTNLSYFDGGRSGIVEVDIPAGRYGIACFLDDAPGGKKDKPHFQLGMKQEFTVS